MSTKNKVSVFGVFVVVVGGGLMAAGLSMNVGESARPGLIAAGALTIAIGAIIALSRWLGSFIMDILFSL